MDTGTNTIEKDQLLSIAERTAGKSKFHLTKMLCFGFHGIITLSTKPLQMAIAMGMSCAFLHRSRIFRLWVNWVVDVSQPCCI